MLYEYEKQVCNLDYQSWGPGFKTTSWLNDRLCTKWVNEEFHFARSVLHDNCTRR